MKLSSNHIFCFVPCLFTSLQTDPSLSLSLSLSLSTKHSQVLHFLTRLRFPSPSRKRRNETDVTKQPSQRKKCYAFKPKSFTKSLRTAHTHSVTVPLTRAGAERGDTSPTTVKTALKKRTTRTTSNTQPTLCSIDSPDNCIMNTLLHPRRSRPVISLV